VRGRGDRRSAELCSSSSCSEQARS
jgi:hypothetical protein